MDYERKSVPTSIAVFGAAGRMGMPVAEHLRYAAPEVELRLITSSEATVEGLRARFPTAEVVVADYLDRSSLDAALKGIEGIFVVTPSGIDEERAMGNLVAAVHSAGAIKHIVRIVGYVPESSPDHVPESLKERGGDGSQHYIAKAVLAQSKLPVTFLNCGATLMDNFLLVADGVRESDTFIYPPRDIPFVDARDLGEVGARLLLSDDARHISQFHTMNNGQDQLVSEDVAQMMSDVFKRKIVHDGSKETFLRVLGPALDERAGRSGEGDYRWDFVAWENNDAVAWALSGFAERILGRRPTSLRDWFMEHRRFFEPSSELG